MAVRNRCSCPESAFIRWEDHVATKQGAGLSKMYLWRVLGDKQRGRRRRALHSCVEDVLYHTVNMLHAIKKSSHAAS